MSIRTTTWKAVKLLLALGLPLAALGAALYFENKSLGPDGSVIDAHIVGIIVLVLGLLPLALMLMGLIALIYIKRRSVGAWLLFACVCYTATSFVDTELRWNLRLKHFEQFAARAEQLVNAIDGYTVARGRAPTKLAHLVPEYLSRVPDTGLGAFPDFVYEPEVQTDKLTTWGLEVNLSASPPERLVYRPQANYADLVGTRQPVGNWIFEFTEINRDP